MKSEKDNKALAGTTHMVLRWLVAPAMVLIIGACSVSILMWANLVRERQRDYSNRIESIMEVHIHATVFHLWLDRYVEGDKTIDPVKIQAHIDKAIYFVDTAIKGGTNEHGVIATPMVDKDLIARADEIDGLLEQFRAVGIARVKNPEVSRMDSPSDLKFDRLYEEILSKSRALEDQIQVRRAKNRAWTRKLYGLIVTGWIAVVSMATLGLWLYEMRRRSIKKQLLAANEQLSSQAAELTAHRENLAEMVEKRTAELTNVNRQLREEVAVRRMAEESLKLSEKRVQQLSTRLVNAQEVERRRISSELHDELGQALTVSKMRLGIIEKWLDKDRNSAKEACAGLSDYLDQVIENVRRLSLCLSPTVLEDLGLSAAIRWLIENCSVKHPTKVFAEIQDIDGLVPRSNWITFYRVVQEACTNIVKHADAENLNLVIRPDGDRVIFIIEDDGRGFDMDAVTGKDPKKKGLGLTTMHERVGAMGGSLEMSSRVGKGTRVTFSIPIAEVKV